MLWPRASLQTICARTFGEPTPSTSIRSSTDAGIPSNFAVESSCTRTLPPAARMVSAPSVPSLPVPERTIPTDALPCSIQNEFAILDFHLRSRRVEEDRIRLNGHPFFDTADLQGRLTMKQLIHHALEIGRKVLDDDKGAAGSLRNCREELLERFEATCGRADTYNTGSRRFFGCFISGFFSSLASFSRSGRHALFAVASCHLHSLRLQRVNSSLP